MKKIISIIVPVFNVEQYLRRCVDSISRQSFSGYCVLLIDDGSSDLSGQYNDEYAMSDSRIVVVHQKNGGLSAARNSGVEIILPNTECEWITFIDSDDWLHPNYLELLFMAACKYNHPVVSGGYLMSIGEDQNFEGQIDAKIELMPTEDYWINNRTNATVAWGKLYRKSLFNKLRYPVGKFHEDEFVTYKILFQCREVVIVKAPLYFYYYNDASISRMNYLKRFPDIIEAFSQHYEYFKNSQYRKALRLETEKYAEAYAYAIFSTRRERFDGSKDMEKVLRAHLKKLLKKHKRDIPFENRKDIYIAAYPHQSFFIRGFGYLKQKLCKN